MRDPHGPGTRTGDTTNSPPLPGPFPLELDSFVGRTEELAALDAFLRAGRLITVTGVGGVGKSRFAVHAAARLRDRYAHGARLVELSSLTDGQLVEHTLVQALGLTDHTTRPTRQVLLDQLADRELLLVLDGFEHLVPVCAPLVRELLRHAPGLRVIAAGRRPLAVEGEQVLALAPMPVADAAQLFTDRAAARLPESSRESPPLPEVLELCRRLDGIPLAVELAAGRIRVLSPGQLLKRLDDRFRLLTGDGQDVLPRHRTLRTAIGWSHELCTAPQRLLWARLSVFSGQFDLDAAEYICGGDGLHADRVLDVLDELIAQSLVVHETTPTGVRYRMLDTVRAYGAQWLAAAGDQDRMRRRHRDWFMGLATWCELEWFSPRQAEVASRIEAELPNVRTALERCLSEPGEAHLGQYFAGALWFHWVGCGRLAEGRYWLDRCLEQPGDRPEPRLKALWVLGYVAVLQGDSAAALDALSHCREEAERTGTALAGAYAVHRMGCLALATDDLPRAETLLSTAMDCYLEHGELNSNVLMGQVEMGMVLAFRGDLAGAVELCEDVRRVCEDHGERWTLAYALYVLALTKWHGGEPDRGRELAQRSLLIDHEFCDLLGTVLSLELVALFTATEGDRAEAAVLMGAASGIWPSVGLRLFGTGHFGVVRERCERMSRDALGDERYEELHEAGARLGADAAVARAIGPRAAGVATELLPGQRRGPRQGSETHEPASSPSVQGGEEAG